MTHDTSPAPQGGDFGPARHRSPLSGRGPDKSKASTVGTNCWKSQRSEVACSQQAHRTARFSVMVSPVGVRERHGCPSGDTPHQGTPSTRVRYVKSQMSDGSFIRNVFRCSGPYRPVAPLQQGYGRKMDSSKESAHQTLADGMMLLTNADSSSLVRIESFRAEHRKRMRGPEVMLPAARVLPGWAAESRNLPG